MQHTAEHVAVFVHVDAFIRHLTYFQGTEKSYPMSR